MGSPMSIGDALLLAKLARTLGCAFTNGRRSAPSEFREVENQLYSLSAALSALGKAHYSVSSVLNIDLTQLSSLSQQPRAENNAGVLESMLQSCEETLRHLKKIVDKYSSLGKPKERGIPVTRKWSQELRDKWKRLAWTTEGGNLAALRSQLTVHTNCLNLILTVAIHTKTDHVEHSIDRVSAMLIEIHTWFARNLQHRKLELRTQT
ncbi:hypothetical protein VTH82DRAFT_3270 [Thermothelomyces myriococcoides]